MGGFWGEPEPGEGVIGRCELLEEGRVLSEEDGDFGGGIELVFELGDCRDGDATVGIGGDDVLEGDEGFEEVGLVDGIDGIVERVFLPFHLHIGVVGFEGEVGGFWGGEQEEVFEGFGERQEHGWEWLDLDRLRRGLEFVSCGVRDLGMADEEFIRLGFLSSIRTFRVGPVGVST